MPLMTKILKPEEFNAVTLAVLITETRGPMFRRWEEMGESTQRYCIDKAQIVLDAMVEKGIIGE